MSKSIVWFRNDLRLHDHLPLKQALEASEEVIPVYVFDKCLWEPDELGFPRTGAFRTRFLLESVAELKEELLKIGSDLLVLEGNTTATLTELVQTYNVDAVYASKEYAYEEEFIEGAIRSSLAASGVRLELIEQSTLFEANSLVWPITDLPDIFTTFRKAMDKGGEIRKSCPAPAQINSPNLEKTTLPTMSSFGFSIHEYEIDDRSSIFPKGGETSALERLEAYFWKGDHLKDYKQTRNGLIGTNYSSKFSLWLAHGCISPRKIYEEVKLYEDQRIKNQSTYWLVFELIWRDYFRFVVKKYGRKVFLQDGIKGVSHFGEPNLESFEMWRLGQTGVPFIDANMRELLHTGFMSNRGRQNVASFLVKDLGVDWRWGARWFESQLIDYDVYSNWCNWMYVAGVGNDPRPHRYFNILGQAKRHDGNGEFVKLWLPELAEVPNKQLHQIDQLSAKELAAASLIIGVDYPKSLVNTTVWQES